MNSYLNIEFFINSFIYLGVQLLYKNFSFAKFYYIFIIYIVLIIPKHNNVFILYFRPIGEG